MDEKKREHARRLIWILLSMLTVCAVLALYKRGVFKTLSSLEELKRIIGNAGAWAGVVYFALQMLTVIVAPIPSNVTMLAGALVLGFLKAMILGVAAVILGSVLLFLAARRLGQRSVRNILNRGVIDRYLPVIQEKQEMFLFLTMLFPFFPDDVICILAGLTQMPLIRFILIMAAARPWGLVFAALLGSGAIHLPLWGWMILVLAMAAIFCLTLHKSRQIEDWLLGWMKKIPIGQKRRKHDDTCAVSQSGD